jgi:hypothetical protein
MPAFLRSPLVLASLLCLAPLTTPGAVAQAGGKGKTYAQQMVDDFLKQHADVTGVELAVVSDKGCATLAASDPKDVGEKCDADEEGPMKTGEPDVEEPSKEDPVYDITQALHDKSGKLIGAVGLDITPVAGRDRAATVAQAKAFLQELEAQIPSKEKLFERR